MKLRKQDSLHQSQPEYWILRGPEYFWNENDQDKTNKKNLARKPLIFGVLLVPMRLPEPHFLVWNNEVAQSHYLAELQGQL